MAAALPILELAGKEIELKNVLLVDDEPQILDMFMAASKLQSKYRVFPFSEGVKALFNFRTYHKKYHIAFIDLILPDISGEKLVKRLIKINPKVPIIAISGEINTPPKGVRYFLEKPFGAKRFENLIEIFSLRERK